MSRRNWIAFLATAGLGVLLVPLIVFLVGRQIAGDYEDPRGLLGLYGSIYGDALAADPAALLLLLSPALLIAIWIAVSMLRRSNAAAPIAPD